MIRPDYLYFQRDSLRDGQDGRWACNEGYSDVSINTNTNTNTIHDEVERALSFQSGGGKGKLGEAEGGSGGVGGSKEGPSSVP